MGQPICVFPPKSSGKKNGCAASSRVGGHGVAAGMNPLPSPPLPPPAPILFFHHHSPAPSQAPTQDIAFAVVVVVASVLTVMLRSVFNASTCLFGAAASSSSSHRARCCAHPSISNPRKLAFSSLHIRPPPGAGRMADVLDILGPLDSIFPPPDGRLFVGLLRRCIKSGNIAMSGMAHGHLMKSGLEAEPLVSNVLLNVYAKAGHLDKCTKLFDEMPLTDVVSWCTLISGYVSHGFDVEAFRLLRGIYRTGLRPNHFIISSVLKSCSNSENFEIGSQVHTAVMKSGMIFDSFVEVGLITMYARVGAVAEALKLFYEIPVKCRVSWNAMISGYVQNGLFTEAMELSREMCGTGFVMDLVTLRVVMSAGSASVMHGFCRNLHAYSLKIGLDRDNFVVAEHVKLLSKLGEVGDIGKHFVKVKKPDACLFSLVISGYYINDCRSDAVKHAVQLFRSDLNMSQGAMVSVINLCLSKEEGRQVHARILKSRHESYVSIRNSLISMYANCGLMGDAEVIFHEMPVHDIVSWTAIMSGHVQNGLFGEVFNIFQSCWETGIVLDQYTITTVINACTGLRALDRGKQVHALLLKLGIEFSDFLAASLLHMYAKCGEISSTTRLFSSSPCPHGLVPVNVMLAGYCWSLLPEKALRLFQREYTAGFVPDGFTFSTVLGACADLKSVVIGQQLHSHIISHGFEMSDVVVGNAIINLYAKTGCIANACRSFYGMRHWDSNSYAMLISGYVQNKYSKLGVKLFCQMHQNGLSANPVILSSVLRGCANLAALELGKQVHVSVLKMGFLSDGYVLNSLVSMYTKSKDMDGAAKILNDTFIRDDTQRNSIITGYSEKVNAGQAYKIFELMKLETLGKEYLCYVEWLRIGVKPSALGPGTYNHAYMVEDGTKTFCSVENTLLVIYSGYIFLKQLHNVFREVTMMDIGSYAHSESDGPSKVVKLLPMERTGRKRVVHMFPLFAYCNYDHDKGGLIRANTGNTGEESLTVESCYYSMVKVLEQTAWLDVCPEFISPMHMKTSPSVCQDYLTIYRDYRNLFSQKRRTGKLAMCNFRNGLTDSGAEECVFNLLERKDRVLVFLVGSQIGFMTSQPFLKEAKSPSPFPFHSWECG